MNTLQNVFFAIGTFACIGAVAQDITRTPIPEGHPLVGTWRIDMPKDLMIKVHARGDRSVICR
jgi:hypothetical protein